MDANAATESGSNLECGGLPPLSNASLSPEPRKNGNHAQMMIDKAFSALSPFRASAINPCSKAAPRRRTPNSDRASRTRGPDRPLDRLRRRGPVGIARPKRDPGSSHHGGEHDHKPGFSDEARD